MIRLYPSIRFFSSAIFGAAVWLHGTHALVAADATAPGTVAVRLHGGRVVRGTVHEKSSADTLWLRAGSGTIALLRPVDWTAVEQVQLPDQTLSATDFRRDFARFITPTPQPAPRTETAPPTPAEPIPAESGEPLAGPPVALLVEAHVANWDADAQPDGVLIHLWPVDLEGRLTPVAATVSAELIGMTGVRRPSPRGQARTFDNQFPIIARATQNITPADFRRGAALVRLPFDGLDPDTHAHVRNLGAVHVQATIPGVTTLEATADAVYLRSPSAVRQRHEATQGTRRLPIER